MSKCDLAVSIDQACSTTVAGDTVTGQVHLRVNQDCTCRKMTITLLWGTHGKGNRAKGAVAQITPMAGELKAGKTHQFPFEFVMPGHPLTYRGQLLNVDWYVQAQVDLPWASDPIAAQEIILVPGGPHAAPVPDLSAASDAADVLQLARSNRTFNVGCVSVIAIGLFIAGIASFMIPPVAVILVAAGGLVLYVGLRNALAEKKLGPVSVRFDRQVLAPGQRCTFTISLQPKKLLMLNGISATVTGQEIVVRGSGTKKTTHAHGLHKETIALAGQTALQAGPQELTGTFRVPDTQAYSFEAKDNTIKWALHVKMDIPKWPNWSYQLPFVVWPLVERGETPPPEKPVDTATASSSEETKESLADDLTGVLSSLGASVFNDHEEIVAKLKGRQFPLRLVVDRVERTTSFDASEKYHDGSTALGAIEGSEIEVALRFRPSRNDEITDLEQGVVVAVQARVVGWDGLYKRVEMEAVEEHTA